MVQLNRSVDSITLKIYSKAMVMIDSSRSGPQAPGWVALPLPASLLTGVNGSYYYLVSIEKNGSSSRALGTGKLVILR
jgi:hypothetical protein